jgi:hypothetical protein
VTWERVKGLDRDLHEIVFYSSVDTSSSFIQQPHKHPQCIVALIDHPEATHGHQCLDVEIDNCKI